MLLFGDETVEAQRSKQASLRLSAGHCKERPHLTWTLSKTHTQCPTTAFDSAAPHKAPTLSQAPQGCTKNENDITPNFHKLLVQWCFQKTSFLFLHCIESIPSDAKAPSEDLRALSFVSLSWVTVFSKEAPGPLSPGQLVAFLPFLKAGWRRGKSRGHCRVPFSASLAQVFHEGRALNSIWERLWEPWQVLPSGLPLLPRAGRTARLAYGFHSLNINPKNVPAAFHCRSFSDTVAPHHPSPLPQLLHLDHFADGGRSTQLTVSLSQLFMPVPPTLGRQ